MKKYGNIDNVGIPEAVSSRVSRDRSDSTEIFKSTARGTTSDPIDARRLNSEFFSRSAVTFSLTFMHSPGLSTTNPPLRMRRLCRSRVWSGLYISRKLPGNLRRRKFFRNVSPMCYTFIKTSTASAGSFIYRHAEVCSKLPSGGIRDGGRLA